MNNVLFIQVISWTSGKKRAVSTLHGRRVRPAGWLVAGDAGSPIPRGGAAATSKPTECFGKEIFDDKYGAFIW